MKHAGLLVLVAVSVLGLSPVQDSGVTSSREGGEVVTLLARDDLLSSYSFKLGQPGGRVEEGELLLDDAQIAFSIFVEDQLSIGFIRNELVECLDLGDFVVPGYSRPLDLAPKPDLSLYHTLELDGNQFVYQTPTKRVRLKNAQSILLGIPPNATRHFEPQVGHVYLLRWKRQARPDSLNLVKFRILDFQPGHSLTFRWERLSP